jgi:hypothetical protein
MSCKKCISTIVFLCHLCLLSTWAASAGLFDLHIGDESYVQTERLAPDLKLSLIMAKLSDIAYQDTLSAADSAFLQDNSIQFEKFFSHHTASFAYHPPYSLTSKTISFDTDGLLAHKMITINGVTKKLIIIAFKGTATGGDIITDALGFPANFIDNEDIEVHLGFHAYMKAFRNNEPSIDHDAIYLITGHSLGGAIAKLYGASLRERGISKENVLVYTFGAPPVAYKAGGFFDRYNKKNGTLPLHIFETAHKLDPVYHLAYKKVLLSYLKRTEDSTYLPFQEDGKIGTLVMGCDTRGVYPLVGKSLFGTSDERPGCELYAHSMGLYTYNIYQNLDMTSIIEANIIDTNPGEDVQIIFNQYQLQNIENLAKNYPYGKGVVGPNFESSKLTRQESIALIHELKKLGIFAGFSMFGSLGDDYQLMIKDIVDSKKAVLEIAKNQIDSAQSLELNDYGELGFGMAVNSASVAADILTIGSAGAAKFAARFPGISAKVVSFGDKFADLSRLGKITVKTMPHIKKAVEISKTPQFQIIKALIESNFVIDDNVKGIIDQNEAGVGLVKVSLGLTGELVKTQFIDKSKGKAYAFMLEKIVDIAGNLIAGTNEVMLTDQELQTAFHELGDAIIDLVPFYGPFHSQWALSKKISAEIDDRPELKEAWANYHSTNQTMLAEVDLLGDATRLKRLDVIMTKALTEIKQHYVQLAEEEALAEAREPKLIIALPEGATIENRHILAQAGETVALSPFLTAKDLIECMADMADYEVLWKLWYYDGTKGVNAPRESLELTLDPGTQTYSFVMPSSQISPVDITYNILNEPDLHRTYGGCGMPQKWETVFADTGEGSGGGSSECPEGATNIACEVGLYVEATSAGGSRFEIDWPYSYIITGNMLKIYTIEDLSNIELVGELDFGVISGSSLRDICVTGGYAYITVSKDYYSGSDPDNGLIIVDINNPNLPTVTGNLNTSGRATKISVENKFAYISDYIDGNNVWVKVIDVASPSDPQLLSSIKTNYSITGLEIQDGHAFIQTGGSGGRFTIFDVSDPFNITAKGSLSLDNALGIHVSGEHAYIMRNGSLRVIDISDLTLPRQIASVWVGVRDPNFFIGGRYLYVTGSEGGLVVVDIANPYSPSIHGKMQILGTDIHIVGSYAYVLARNVSIIDISNPVDLPKIRQISPSCNTGYRGLHVENEYAYAGCVGTVDMINIGDIDNMVREHVFNKYSQQQNYDIIPSKILFGVDAYGYKNAFIMENKAFIAAGSKFNIFDISDKSNPILVGELPTSSSRAVFVKDDYAYVTDFGGGSLLIINISDPNFPVLEKSVYNVGTPTSIFIKDNYAYLSFWGGGVKIFDISNPSEPVAISTFGTATSYVTGYYEDVAVYNQYAFAANRVFGVQVYDISDPYNPKLLTTIQTFSPRGINVVGEYIYIADYDEGLKVINWQEHLRINEVINNYRHPTTYLSLLNQVPYGTEILLNSFTKAWTFSEDISEFNIEVVNNSYANFIVDASFVKNTSTLTVELTPNTSQSINMIELRFSKGGNPVKINGSDTFWAISRTNHAPRLADGQATQLISATTESAWLTINTFDADADSITLTVEDGAGGYVGFDPEQPNRLFASFADGQSLHTIKIGLNDGKEKVIKELTVMQFDQGSVIDFYSDVDPASPDYFYDGIAFATLKGVVSGQPDPNDSTKRIFRPTDNASLAEALAMVINAEKLAGLIALETSNTYQEVFPAWAMPYYTFARDTNALDEEMLNLANVYPTREEVAKFIVKTLDLDEKAKILPALNVVFTDEDQFSDADMLYYGKITHGFGLFMTGEDAQPLQYITRAELALVIKNIFMIPTATLTLTPASVEYGDSFDISLTDAEAEAINSSINLHDSSDQLTFITIVNQQTVTSPVASADIFAQAETIHAFVDNQGVRNVIAAPLQIIFSDQDSDGVQDRHDRWPADSRYSTDANGNNIPDLLDSLYSLSGYDQNSVISIDGQLIAVSEIITNGGVFPPDLNGDGIADDEDGTPVDAILALQVLVGQQPTLIITTGDVDGDGRIGMAEALHAMQQSAQSAATK